MVKKVSLGGNGISITMDCPGQFYWDEFLKLNNEERVEILAGVHDSELREKLSVNYAIWFYDKKAQDLLLLWADSEFDLIATRLKWN